MKKIAKIIPFHKMPRGIDFFDYAIPENLSGKINPGDQVLIPLKKSQGQGLVYELTDHSDFENLKLIIGKNEKMPSLNKAHLNFITWFARNYYYSLPSTIKLFLPEQLTRQAQVRKLPTDYSWGINVFKSDQKIKKIAKQIYQAKNKKYLVLDQDYHHKVNLLIELISESLKEKKQVLMIEPTLEKINDLISYLPKKFQEQAVVISKDASSSKSAHLKIWNNIYQNKTKIIIGTRSALFYPFNNLAWIVVDEIQSPDHKSWDQNPRFHAIDCAKQMQRFYDCHLLLSGCAPAVEDFHQARQEKYQLITLGRDFTEKDTKIYNLRDARQDQFTYLSWPLLNDLRELLEKKQTAILIVNKKGYASQLQCLDCQHVFLCPNCGLPETVVKGKLKCFHCKTEKNIPLVCAKCKGTNLKSLGIGQDQVFDLIKKEFPDCVVSVDPKNKAQIYILTGAIPHDLWEKTKYLGLVYLDSLIHLPDVYSNEKLYQTLRSYVYQAKKWQIPLSLQTAFPENLAMKSVFLSYQNFFQEELSNRKNFNYPPYSNLVVLFNETRDQFHGVHDAKILYDRLVPVCKENNVEINAPVSYYRQHVRGKYRQLILLRFKENDLKTENLVLRHVPQTWTIDKRPQNVI